MKKILAISVVVLMLAATYGFAQTDSGVKGELKQQDMKMDEEMMTQMMDNGMMKKMMADKKDGMQMMMDLMTMQEKMLQGPKAAEKKKMMKDLAQMKEKMQKMMSMPMDMKCMGAPKPKENAGIGPKNGEPAKTDPHKH